ncbi:hypothetical protein C3F09_09510 [candidate division GN15 bacterium]|uniref:Uncharacterized protein n=1 Tax=candidate division GN15 bacterium TaxID=2072418 RepID=A0A855X4P7_9BACT|nr:MAG: hypothetical protein C3F09_09510 [candidate division GN15 bacterium]
MQENQRTIRPALAVIVLICFFMPFLKISCGGQPIASITGIDLAMGKKIEPPNPFGNTPGGTADRYRSDQSANTGQTGEDQLQFNNPSDSTQQFASSDSDNPFGSGTGEAKIDPQPVAAVSLGLAVIALLGALGASRRAMLFSAVAAAISAILLFILKSNMSGDIPPQMAAVLAFEWTWSYWVALLGSAGLALFTAKLLMQKEETRQAPRLIIQTYSEKPPSETVKH